MAVIRAVILTLCLLLTGCYATGEYAWWDVASGKPGRPYRDELGAYYLAGTTRATAMRFVAGLLLLLLPTPISTSRASIPGPGFISGAFTGLTSSPNVPRIKTILKEETSP